MLPGLASPGRTASVSRPSAVYSRVTMAGSSGRGPTSDISPRSTFQSWGSSSTFTARSHAPNGNTRGSRGPVMRLESERRRRCIVRSLNMMNGRRSRPTRSARYRTGPADDRRMPTAARATSGAATTAASAASTTSTRRLATAQRATHSHEHLGGLQTLLVTPCPGTVAQRLERAGVRIRPQLALVARHRGQLLLECRRDVHPGVGHEATGKPPFGAAGGVVGVHRLDRRLGSPGGDEHGLEQDLVIAVDVAPVLAVDDLRLHFPDDALERRDDLGEGESVEPLVRKAERAEIGDAEDVGRAAHVLGLADPGGGRAAAPGERAGGASPRSLQSAACSRSHSPYSASEPGDNTSSRSKNRTDAVCLRTPNASRGTPAVSTMRRQIGRL